MNSGSGVGGGGGGVGLLGGGGVGGATLAFVVIGGAAGGGGLGAINFIMGFTGLVFGFTTFLVFFSFVVSA